MTKRQLKKWKRQQTRSIVDDCTVQVSSIRDGAMCLIEYRPERLLIGPFTDHSTLNTFRLGDDHYVLVAIDETDGIVVRDQNNAVVHYSTTDFVEWVVKRVLQDKSKGRIRSRAEMEAKESGNG